MRKIDTSSWREIRLDDLFEKIHTEKIDGKANDFPTHAIGEYKIPLVTAGLENQGLSRFAKRKDCPTILQNAITIAANGTGAAFYQEEEFAILQDSYAIRLKTMDIPSREVGLFLASCINKVLDGNFSWTYKAGWHRVKNLSIKLPVKEMEEIDWDYMQEHIAELEQEHIAELEQYLIVTGLSDYTLTEEDRNILSLAGFGNHENPDRENLVRDCKEMREFRCRDLFETSNGDIDLQKKHINNKGIMVVSSGVENNGIIGSTDVKAKEFSPNTITIDMFGNAYYREETYKMVTHARVFSLSPLFDGFNNLNGQYIVSQFKYLSTVYNYSNMCSWNKIKNDFLLLPIQTNEANAPILDSDCKYHPDGYLPDWEFMERYIKAIEKIVIADVVKYKDEVLEKTRAIVERKIA